MRLRGGMLLPAGFLEGGRGGGVEKYAMGWVGGYFCEAEMSMIYSVYRGKGKSIESSTHAPLAAAAFDQCFHKVPLLLRRVARGSRPGIWERSQETHRAEPSNSYAAAFFGVDWSKA